jgi:hypothetical protein
MPWYTLAIPLVGGALGFGFIGVDLYHLVKRGNSIFSGAAQAVIAVPLVFHDPSK